MAGLNKVQIIGNLGADPEVRSVGDSKVAQLRIAVSEAWTNKSGERQEETEWFTVEFWNRQAEIAEQYLRKGSKVYVEGKLKTDSWEDAETNEKKYRTKVRGMAMQMLDRAPEGAVAGGSRRSTKNDSDDLPF